jgi:hypothetical protein
MASRTPFDAVKTAWLRKPTRAVKEVNRPRSGRAAALLGFARCADFETGKHDHHWKAAGAGVGIKPEPAQAPVPLDHREFARPASRAQGGKAADGMQNSSVGGRSGQVLAVPSAFASH